jgi:DMSO reductase anchor subunit
MKTTFLPMLPLVIFTALEIAAVGLAIPVIEEYLLYAAVASGVGIAISLLHLGQKRRFLRAIAGIGHSWLSREVLAAAIFTGSAGAAYISARAGWPEFFTDLAAAAAVLSAVVLALTIGMVYNLPFRLTWAGISNCAAPLLTALVLGSYILHLKSADRRFFWLFLILWCVDVMFSAWRLRTLHGLKKNKHRFVFMHLAGLTGAGHAARLVLSVIAMVSAWVLPGLAVVVIIAVIAVDRFIFYTGMVGISPESQIAHLKSERMKEAALGV